MVLRNGTARMAEMKNRSRRIKSLAFQGYTNKKCALRLNKVLSTYPLLLLGFLANISSIFLPRLDIFTPTSKRRESLNNQIMDDQRCRSNKVCTIRRSEKLARVAIIRFTNTYSVRSRLRYIFAVVLTLSKKLSIVNCFLLCNLYY